MRSPHAWEFLPSPLITQPNLCSNLGHCSFTLNDNEDSDSTSSSSRWNLDFKSIKALIWSLPTGNDSHCSSIWRMTMFPAIVICYEENEIVRKNTARYLYTVYTPSFKGVFSQNKPCIKNILDVTNETCVNNKTFPISLSITE